MIKKTILHTDRSPIMRLGFSYYLQQNPNFEIVQNLSNNSDQILLNILRHKPDITILDVENDMSKTLNLINCLIDQEVNTKIIIKCDIHNCDYISQFQLEQLDISLIAKPSTLKEIEACLKQTSSGNNYTAQAFKDLKYRKASFNNINSSFETRYTKLATKKLTNKEREIMKLISGGKSTMQIADKLCLSHRTIDAHRLNILKKLCLKGKNALIHFAVENRNTWT